MDFKIKACTLCVYVWVCVFECVGESAPVQKCWYPRAVYSVIEDILSLRLSCCYLPVYFICLKHQHFCLNQSDVTLKKKKEKKKLLWVLPHKRRLCQKNTMSSYADECPWGFLKRTENKKSKLHKKLFKSTEHIKGHVKVREIICIMQIREACRVCSVCTEMLPHSSLCCSHCGGTPIYIQQRITNKPQTWFPSCLRKCCITWSFTDCL